MEGELAVETKRDVTMCNGDGRAARDHSMAVDGRDGERVTIGRAIVVVGAHVEGDGRIFIGGRQIVCGHRRDVLGTEHKVLGDRGSARVRRRDGYIVIAIVQDGADRSVSVQRAGDLAGIEINRQARGQACRREFQRIAIGIGERALGNNRD